MGNPLNNNEVGFFGEFNHELPANVEIAYHPMALDLNRVAFKLDRIAPGNNVDFEEVWFRGGHGDIGGNAKLKSEQPNRLRTNIALSYMFKKAMAIGINFDSLNLSEYPTDKTAPVVISNNRLDRAAGSPPDISREPQISDRFHNSLFEGEEVIPPQNFKSSGYEDEDFFQRFVSLPGIREDLQIENH